jgi:hypothetical protein
MDDEFSTANENGTFCKERDCESDQHYDKPGYKRDWSLESPGSPITYVSENNIGKDNCDDIDNREMHRLDLLGVLVNWTPPVLSDGRKQLTLMSFHLPN